MVIVPGATHLFEESGALEKVADPVLKNPNSGYYTPHPRRIGPVLILFPFQAAGVPFPFLDTFDSAPSA